MHPSLEKRLRGGLLAFSIGVGSLGLSGCATNNPALNAFMNYGVAPVIAADAGRSQQTVVVNGGQQTVHFQSPSISYPLNAPLIFVDGKETRLMEHQLKTIYDSLVTKGRGAEKIEITSDADKGTMKVITYDKGKILESNTIPYFNIR